MKGIDLSFNMHPERGVVDEAKVVLLCQYVSTKDMHHQLRLDLYVVYMLFLDSVCQIYVF